MAGKKDIDYYLAQARRIAEHREQGAEEEIRELFRKTLKELKGYIAEVHEKYAAGDGTLSFADLQKAGYDARFLEEIEKRISVATPKVAREVDDLVQETYRLAYESMIQGVTAQGVAGMDDAFSEAVAITPEQIGKIVKNPVMEVALEKNHRDIVYDIKQAVAVGLMNGDRYATIAQKISVALDKENGPYKNAIRIARTEAHRAREMGNMDAALEVDKELQNGTTGMREVKIWRTMKDERVRPQQRRKGKKGWSTRMGKGPNHMKLAGQTVLADEPFDLLDGYTAMSPGQSGIAGHDINCRCYVSYKLMDDAEYFKATGKHFPGYKGDEEPKAEESNEQEKAKEEKPPTDFEKIRLTGIDADYAPEMEAAFRVLMADYPVQGLSVKTNKATSEYGHFTGGIKGVTRKGEACAVWNNEICISRTYGSTRQISASAHRRTYSSRGSSLKDAARVDLVTIPHEYGHAIDCAYALAKDKTLSAMVEEYRVAKKITLADVAKINDFNRAIWKSDKRLSKEIFDELQAEYGLTYTETIGRINTEYGSYAASSISEFLAEGFANMRMLDEDKKTDFMKSFERIFKRKFKEAFGG